MPASSREKAAATKRALPAASLVARPRARTAEKRLNVLKAAMDVFGSKGYNNGSLMEIAQQAGMTPAGITHHFGSKEQLLIAMLEYRDSSDVSHLDGAHVPEGRPMLEHLVTTAKVNVDRPGVVQAYAVLSADSVTDGHPAQEFFRERFAGLREMIVSGLHDASPESPDEDLLMAASTIIATMDGLQVQWLLDPEAVDMPRSVEAVIESMVAWLKKNARPTTGRSRQPAPKPRARRS